MGGVQGAQMGLGCGAGVGGMWRLRDGVWGLGDAALALLLVLVLLLVMLLLLLSEGLRSMLVLLLRVLLVLVLLLQMYLVPWCHLSLPLIKREGRLPSLGPRPPHPCCNISKPSSSTITTTATAASTSSGISLRVPILLAAVPLSRGHLCGSSWTGRLGARQGKVPGRCPGPGSTCRSPSQPMTLLLVLVVVVMLVQVLLLVLVLVLMLVLP